MFSVMGGNLGGAAGGKQNKQNEEKRNKTQTFIGHMAKKPSNVFTQRSFGFATECLRLP